MQDSDISAVLANWPYSPDDSLQIRRIEGADGNQRIQLRVDLGLLQMHSVGRPDGTRPYGAESLLDHFRDAAERHRHVHGWYEGFELHPESCRELQRESLQHYHRRIAFLALQEYGRAVADADHNLQILDLLKAFAVRRDDWLVMEQYRGFIVSQRAQAAALQHLSREDVRGALLAAEEGIRALREIYAEQDRLDDWEESAELESLQDLRRKLQARYQVSHRQRLQLLLDEAQRREEPDLAADLRAQLRRLDPEL